MLPVTLSLTVFTSFRSADSVINECVCVRACMCVRVRAGVRMGHVVVRTGDGGGERAEGVVEVNVSRMPAVGATVARRASAAMTALAYPPHQVRQRVITHQWWTAHSSQRHGNGPREYPARPVVATAAVASGTSVRAVGVEYQLPVDHARRLWVCFVVCLYLY